jgi:hypothetical protein
VDEVLAALAKGGSEASRFYRTGMPPQGAANPKCRTCHGTGIEKSRGYWQTCQCRG